MICFVSRQQSHPCLPAQASASDINCSTDCPHSSRMGRRTIEVIAPRSLSPSWYWASEAGESAGTEAASSTKSGGGVVETLLLGFLLCPGNRKDHTPPPPLV